MVLYIKRLTGTAKSPVYGTKDSAGMDLHADETITIQPGETALIHTGLSFQIPVGFVGLVCPRSGLSMRTALRQPNSVGVIDADYRGEVRGMFQNTGDAPITIQQGDRFAQMVIVPFVHPQIEDAAELSATARGIGGFGSTGV